VLDVLPNVDALPPTSFLHVPCDLSTILPRTPAGVLDVVAGARRKTERETKSLLLRDVRAGLAPAEVGTRTKGLLSAISFKWFRKRWEQTDSDRKRRRHGRPVFRGFKKINHGQAFIDE